MVLLIPLLSTVPLLATAAPVAPWIFGIGLIMLVGPIAGTAIFRLFQGLTVIAL